MSCPICINAEATEQGDLARDVYKIACPQCGVFHITREAKINLTGVDLSQRWKVSAWVNEALPQVLSAEDLDRALIAGVPSLSHRADRMLRWMSSTFPPGKQFTLSHLGLWENYKFEGREVAYFGGTLKCSRLVPVGWNRDIAELEFMVAEVLCNELGFLISQNNHEYQVSPKGLLRLEGRSAETSTRGFCAMWFSAEVFPLWTDVIEPAIRSAGYEPLRIDNKEHNGKIDDEIVASIRASRFVVSDFSGHRGGVYYEAGFAHGLGLPVIFMCRESDMKELHFDIRQYNCIEWSPDKLEEARDRLKNRILATLGQGPLRVK